MQASTEHLLRKIGQQLDSFVFPCVMNGGIVVPSALAVSPVISGKEYKDGKSRENRSGTQPGSQQFPRQRSSGASAASSTSGASGAPREAASVFGTSVRTKYQDELSDVETAYPGLQYWSSNDELWLLAESALLPGFFVKANFLIGISFTGKIVRSWGFWGGSAFGFQWIGPRHTNFPDGSICAFEPKDRTWALGDPLVELLDLYTVWAVRHMHLKILGRWPGCQSVAHAYERILELRSDEYCGCANSHKLYGECCMRNDAALNQVREAVKFTFHMHTGLRTPPQTVIDFLFKRSIPPSLAILAYQPVPTRASSPPAHE